MDYRLCWIPQSKQLFGSASCDDESAMMARRLDLVWMQSIFDSFDSLLAPASHLAIETLFCHK